MKTMISIFMSIALLAAAGISACAVEEEAGQDEVSLSRDEGAEGEQTAALEETEIAPAEDEAEVLAGCSVVQFCDVPPGQPFPEDGARCLQQACSKSAARAECINETPGVCGTPKCPWWILYLDGSWEQLC